MAAMPTATAWRGGESVGPRSGGRSGKGPRGLDAQQAAEAAAGKRPSSERAVIRLVAAFEEQTNAAATTATPPLAPAPLSFAAFASLWASSGGAQAFFGGGVGAASASAAGPAAAAQARAHQAQALFSAALECLGAAAASLLAEDEAEAGADDGGAEE
jgi:hypothetical protein